MSRIKVPTLVASGVLAAAMSLGSLVAGSGTANADYGCGGGLYAGWNGVGANGGCGWDGNWNGNVGWPGQGYPPGGCNWQCSGSFEERAQWRMSWDGPPCLPSERVVWTPRGTIFVVNRYPDRRVDAFVNDYTQELDVIWR